MQSRGDQGGEELEAAVGWDRRQQGGQEQQRQWWQDWAHRVDKVAAATTAPQHPHHPLHPLPCSPTPCIIIIIYLYFYLMSTSGYEWQQPSCGISPLPSIRNSNYSSNFNN